jgi:hypothetical protein
VKEVWFPDDGIGPLGCVDDNSISKKSYMCLRWRSFTRCVLLDFLLFHFIHSFIIQTFIALEKEIEDSLPQFQELILSLR